MHHHLSTSSLGLGIALLANLALPAQQALHTANGAAPGDNLGHSAAMCRDVDWDGVPDAVVGAPGADVNGAQSGSVRVLSGLDGSALFTVHGDSAGDALGTSVAAAGDVNGDGYVDVIAGAPGDDNAGTDSGSARVYSGFDGSILHSFDGLAAGDLFGWSVGGAGDVNGDGFDDVVIGAPQAVTIPGYAQVRNGRTGAILYTLAGGGAANRNFGTSVGGAGDVNADGFADVVVGDSIENSSLGAVRVFSGQNGSVLHKFDGSSPNRLLLGTAVGGAGDVNADGFDDIVASAFDPQDIGSAVVYSGADGSVLYAFAGTLPDDLFGRSVGGAGDVNGDGFADVIVGAPQNGGTTPTGEGYALVFSGQNGRILQSFRGIAVGDRLGTSVAGGADVDLDGFADLVAGAPGESNRAGVARVFSGTPYGQHDARLTTNPAAAASHFGYSVSTAGDVDNDGVDDYVVGAVFESSLGRTRNGVARVFSGADDSLLYTFHGTANDDRFGHDVGGAGDVNNDGHADLLVGAPEFGNSGGLVRVFSGLDGSILRTWLGATGERVGSAVAGLGDVDGDGTDDVAVGMPGAQTATGTVRVFSGLTGTMLYDVVGATAGEELGTAIATLGDLDADAVNDFVVGAPRGWPVPHGPGTARVCSGADGATIHQLPSSGAADGFGLAVAGVGDVTRDGLDDFAVGAPFGNLRGVESGYMRVYSGADASMVYEALGLADDRLGGAVDGGGDVNGDGVPDILVGAIGAEAVGGVRTGRAYVYSGLVGAVRGPIQILRGLVAGDRYGWSVANLGDVDGDGYADFAVGAVTAGAAGPNSGSVSLYDATVRQDPGAAVEYGAGCVGSAGSLPRCGRDGRPLLGQTFTTTLVSAPASSAAFLSFGSTETRLDLGVIGMPTCTLLTLPVVTIPLPTSPTGTASFALSMPNVAALVGGVYFQQWFALDPPANTLGLIVSSGLDVTVGTP